MYLTEQIIKSLTIAR